MMPVLLLAKSFIRQNRWLLLAFVLWPFLLGAFVWAPHHAAARDDVAEIVQQEIFYGVAVAAFLTSSAIYNEKRSRRIIGVLSKAVSRSEYLLGLMLGSGCFAAAYFIAVGVSMIWLLGFSDSIPSISLKVLWQGIIASLWIASLALLFSTFLYPFIAAALAGAFNQQHRHVLYIIVRCSCRSHRDQPADRRSRPGSFIRLYSRLGPRPR